VKSPQQQPKRRNAVKNLKKENAVKAALEGSNRILLNIE
jgi:hypothetical protein